MGTHPLVESPLPAQLLSRPCVSKSTALRQIATSRPLHLAAPRLLQVDATSSALLDDRLGQEVGDGTSDRGTSRADNEREDLDETRSYR